MYDDWLEASLYGEVIAPAPVSGPPKEIVYPSSRFEKEGQRSSGSESEKSFSYGGSEEESPTGAPGVTGWADIERVQGMGGDIRLATAEERAVGKLREILGNEKEVERIVNVFGPRIPTFHIPTLAAASTWLRSKLLPKNMESFCKERSVNPPDLVRYIAILQSKGFR